MKMLKANEIADLLDPNSEKYNEDDPLIITPQTTSLKDLRSSGAASIDLRLGCWFVTLRQARLPYMQIQAKGQLPDPILVEGLEEILNYKRSVSGQSQRELVDKLGQHINKLKKTAKTPQAQLIKTHYVRFGDEFFLHPDNFVLGITLEWIRLPSNLAGYLTSRSKWGRRGLVIATATGVHPGFTGCLTLELCNLGEIPISIRPGMAICQFFLHRAGEGSEEVDKSKFIGKRKPVLGKIEDDFVSTRLAIDE